MNLIDIGKSRIARKLLKVVVLISIFITLVMTVIQIYQDYRNDIEDINHHMDVIQSGYLSSLSRSLWVYDDEQMRVQLEGILVLPGVVFVEISHEGKIIGHAGRPSLHRTIEKKFRLVHHENGKATHLGTLLVVNDLDRVFSRLKRGALMILVGNALMILLISGFILVFFHFLVTKHLIELGHRLGSINIESRDEFTGRENFRVADRPLDEIQRVVAATEAMRQRIYNSFEELHRSEERYRKLISQMSAGFALHEMIYDESGRPCDYRFLEINSAFESLTGLRAEMIIGKTVLEVLPGTEKLWIETFGRVALTGRSEHLENYSEELGSYFDVTAYAPAENQFAVIFNDVSERKIAEKKQAQLRESLEAKVMERTEDLRQRVDESERLNRAMVNLLDDLQTNNRQLEALSQQLAEANKELEAFAYSVSHDLRAPLRAIDGYVRILLEDHSASLDVEGKRVCGVISENARDMGRLIDDLLSFSRLGRAAINLSLIDMATLSNSIFHELTTPVDRERIDIHIDSLPSVQGDPNLIRQVWRNLIGNAIKFSSKKESVIIEIRAEETVSEVIYSVRDNGAGFDMRYVDKLFGVFQRLHGIKEFEGTGVGLAIVQRIIHRHGGRVWAEGVPEEGAVVFFTFVKESDYGQVGAGGYPAG